LRHRALHSFPTRRSSDLSYGRLPGPTRGDVMTESTSGYNHPENESLPSRDYERQIALLSAKNERLAEALRAARDQIVELKKQLDDLAKPPGTYAVFLGAHPDGSVDISSAGRKMHVSASPSLDVTRLLPGQEVKLN